MSNNNAANVSSPSDPMSSAFADCRTRVKLFCRFVLVVGFLGIIFYFMDFSAYLACCPILIWSSYGVGLYTIFTSFLIAGSPLSALFALLSIGMTLATLEETKGTLSCAALVGQLTFLTNVIVIVISFLCYLAFDSFALGCTYGFWPAVFGLMVLDCMSNPEGLRNLCCFPIQIKSKFYPWIMLLLFSLLTQTINAGMFGGLLVGYLLHFKPQLQLSIQTATRWENRINWIQSWDGYIPVSASGVSGGGGSDGGSWAYGNRNAESQAEQQPAAPARPSVFSGQGHRLGGGPAQSASFMSSILPSSLSSSSAGGAATGADGPTVASMDPAAQAAARAKRAAAFEKRMSKASSSSSTSSSTTATITTTKPSSSPRASNDVELTSIQVVPSNSTGKYDRPPSPSRITSTTSSSLAAPSAAVFQIGDVDSDDDIYAVEDDNTTMDQARQQEQRNEAADKLAEALNSDDGEVSAAAPGGSKFPSPDAAFEGEFDPDLEAQGFDSGNNKKKKGLFSKLKSKATSSSSSGYDKLQKHADSADEEDDEDEDDSTRPSNDNETVNLM